jgi:hypothetical protein
LLIALALGPAPGPAPASPTLEFEALPWQRGPKQGTKQQRRQVDAEELLQVQILGEIDATYSQTIDLEQGLRRGKRVKKSTKQ